MADVFRLQLSIAGAKEIVDVAIPMLRTKLGDLREFWLRYVAPKIYRDIQDNFASEGGAVGGWAPLSPSYAAWKAKHYPGRPILVRTGALKQSMALHGERPGPEGVLEVSRDALIIGTRIRHARHHQRAGRRQRRFLFLSNSREFGKLLHQYAIDQAKAAGLRTREALRRGAA